MKRYVIEVEDNVELTELTDGNENTYTPVELTVDELADAGWGLAWTLKDDPNFTGSTYYEGQEYVKQKDMESNIKAGSYISYQGYDNYVLTTLKALVLSIVDEHGYPELIVLNERMKTDRLMLSMATPLNKETEAIDFSALAEEFND